MPGYPAVVPVGISTALSAKERRKKALRRWERDRDVGSLNVTGQFIVFIVSSHLFQIRFAKGALLLNLQEYSISQFLW